MYHYVIIHAVMRDCKSAEDAKKKCEALLPQYPDENTKHMESWEVIESKSAFAIARLNRGKTRS